MTEHINSTAKKGSAWLGPVIGALIIIGGYIAYDHWKDANEHRERCASLQRQFMGNMDALQGPVDRAIEESNRVGSQAPIGSLADQVFANQAVLDQLNAECPDWTSGEYASG